MDLIWGVRSIKRDMMRWFNNREYYAKNESSITYSCYYYVESINIKGGTFVNHPTVIINVRVVKAYRGGKVMSKPVSGAIRRINNSFRRVIFHDIRWELSMFGINSFDYNIKVGNIKWLVK